MVKQKIKNEYDSELIDIINSALQDPDLCSLKATDCESDDVICIPIYLLCRTEDVLVYIANHRSVLTCYVEEMEDNLFDEWLCLYNVVKGVISKRHLSDEDTSQLQKAQETLKLQLAVISEKDSD